MCRTRIAAGLGLALALAAAVLASVATAAVNADGKLGPSAINGVYRWSWTPKQLQAAGTSADYAQRNAATITMTFTNGRFRMQVREDPSFKCSGKYHVETIGGKKQFSMSLHSPTACPDGSALIVANWSLGNGYLRWRNLVVDPYSTSEPKPDAVFFGGKAWKKIG